MDVIGVRRAIKRLLHESGEESRPQVREMLVLVDDPDDLVPPPVTH
jgi:hypothetical protein